MRFEDMKNNIPETPDFIHEMIKNEVDRQLQENKNYSDSKRKGKDGTKQKSVAAAAIVCVLATTTAAYAGVKMYRTVCGKTGPLQVLKTGITSENKLADLPAQIHDINFKDRIYSGGHEMGRRVTSGISAKQTHGWIQLCVRTFGQ